MLAGVHVRLGPTGGESVQRRMNTFMFITLTVQTFRVTLIMMGTQLPLLLKKEQRMDTQGR